MKIFTRLLIAALLSALCITQVTAEVYKRTNPDGSVEFTDVPSKQEQEPVKLRPMSTFKAQPQLMPQTPSSTVQSSTDAYTALRITSPANEATIRENSGSIKVSVSVTPALHPDHKLVVLVDGTPQGESTSGNFTLSNLDRGSHSLGAQVVDKAGKPQISATPVTVYLHRQSLIKPKRFIK